MVGKKTKLLVGRGVAITPFIVQWLPSSIWHWWDHQTLLGCMVKEPITHASDRDTSYRTSTGTTVHYYKNRTSLLRTAGVVPKAIPIVEKVTSGGLENNIATLL